MMTVPPGREPFSDADLERALRDLGDRVVFPATPELATRVSARLGAAPAVPRRWWTGLLPPRRPAFAAAAVALLVLVAALAVWPQFRTAIADRLGVSGIRIVFDEETPTPAATPVGTSLLLGERTTLAVADARVGYDVHVPDELGEPDEVYLRALPDGNQMVSFVYLPAADLPETAATGAAALLIQFAAAGETMYLAKNLGMDATMYPVTVNGGEGWWISGGTNLFLIQDPSAVCCGPLRRPNGNILLWEQDGITFRLEAGLGLRRMLEIAGTVRSLTESAGTPAGEP